MCEMTKIIAQLRKQKQWSQNRLAQAAKLHPSTVSLIESGRFAPGAGQMKRIAKALGVSVTVLWDVPPGAQQS
jgi:transcriptional regulator with XRE-family HTH domain